MASLGEVSQRDQVKSSARSLDILEYLSDRPGGATLSEIHLDLRIPISSLHGILMTMTKKGFVIRDNLTLMYHLGPKIGQIAGSYYEQMDLIQVAAPFMSRLARLTGKTTSLTVLHEDKVVFVHKVVGEGVLQIVNPVGTMLAAHATGSGKSMLACLPEAEIDRIYPREHLEQFTPNTITSRKKLKIQLQEISQCGYALDNAESSTGIWAVAACVRDRSRRPVAAVSVVSLVGRASEQDYKAWVQDVKEIAGEISAALGFMAKDQP